MTASRTRLAWLVVIVLACAALRFAVASTNPLWCDEVVSTYVAVRVKEPLDVFRLTFDNNHPLNTFALRYLATDGADLGRRIVSVIASCLTVLVAARIGWRHAELLGGDRQRAWSSALAGAALTGICYPIVLYGGEARGYGLELLFVATGLLAILEREHAHGSETARARARNGWLAAAVWGLSCALALTAHLSALFAVLAGAVWSVVFAWKRIHGVGRQLGFVALWNLVPCAAALAIYFGFAAHLRYAFGPAWSYATVFGELSALATGLSYDNALWIGGPVLLAGLALGLAAHFRRGANAPALAAYFAVGIVLAPIAVLALRPPEYVQARYFLLPLQLFLLLLPAALPARTAPLWARVAVGLLALLAAAGNAIELRDLVRHGRGQYMRCLEAIDADARASEKKLVIGIGADFRIGSVLTFYLRRLGSFDRVVQVGADSRMQEADWLLYDPTSAHFEQQTIAIPDGIRFERVHDCPTARAAGVAWRSFRRVRP